MAIARDIQTKVSLCTDTNSVTYICMHGYSHIHMLCNMSTEAPLYIANILGIIVYT